MGSSSWPQHIGAHPRSRGENAHLREILTHASWLIPAHAGKTRASSAPTPAHRAHPRSRGENLQHRPSRCLARGSSPLTRGKRAGVLLGWPACRLIPAHAGKTTEALRVLKPGGAHPRSRGENMVSVLSVCRLGGSSPLTRGKPLVKSRAIEEARLIPAHAGKTIRSAWSRPAARAHPRSRGENQR